MDSDSLIMIAVRYYSISKDLLSRFRSYYTLGCIYNETGRYTNATVALSEAERLVDHISNNYRNGVVLTPGNPKMIEADNYVEKWNENDFYKETISIWGLFEVEDSVISLEYYLPSMYGHHTYLMRGIILNDTTFQMTKGKRSDKSEYESMDRLYRFRQTDAKPDSTNKFFN